LKPRLSFVDRKLLGFFAVKQDKLVSLAHHRSQKAIFVIPLEPVASGEIGFKRPIRERSELNFHVSEYGSFARSFFPAFGGHKLRAHDPVEEIVQNDVKAVQQFVLCERTVPRRKRIDNRLTHDSDFRTAPCSTGKHFGGRDKENP
jgi:hypothetical protein